MIEMYGFCVKRATSYLRSQKSNSNLVKRILQSIYAFALCLFMLLGATTKVEAAYVTYNGYTFDTTQDAPSLESGVYQITTAKQLAWMAYMVNTNATYATYSYALAADIDISGIEWTPIGNKVVANQTVTVTKGAGVFSGSFDGGGHAISGLTITTGANCSGLFGVSAGGSISNVTIQNPSVSGGVLTGALLGYSGKTTGYTGGTTLTNCTVSGGSVEGTGETGGLVGWCFADIIECTNNGTTVTRNASGAGGSGDTPYTGFGGIAGGVDGPSVIVRYCKNTGTVNSNGHNSVGGICGNSGSGDSANPAFFYGCVNEGEVIGENAEDVAGIVGGANGCVIINGCLNKGTITGGDSDSDWGTTGGITANLRAVKGSSYVIGCMNSGTVNGTTNTGGIIARSQTSGSYTANVLYNINVGVINATSTTNAGQISGGKTTGTTPTYTLNFYDSQYSYNVKGIANADATSKAEAKSTIALYNLLNADYGEYNGVSGSFYAEDGSSAFGAVAKLTGETVWTVFKSGYPVPYAVHSHWNYDVCEILKLSMVAALQSSNYSGSNGNYDLQIDQTFTLPYKISNSIAITWIAEPSDVLNISYGTGNTCSATIYEGKSGIVTLTPSVDGTPCPDATITLNIRDISQSTLEYLPDPIPDYVWTGEAIEPTITPSLYFGRWSSTTEKAAHKIDNSYLTIEYEDNVDPGVATIVIKGTNGYYGEQRVTFNIVPIHKITGVSYANSEEAWTGSEIEVDYNALTVTYTECQTKADGSFDKFVTGQTVTGDALKDLVDAGQIILTYSNNVDRGTATVKVEGDGKNFDCQDDDCYSFNFNIRMELRDMVLSLGYTAYSSVARSSVANLVTVYDKAGNTVDKTNYTITYYDKNGNQITGSGNLQSTSSPITIRATVNTTGVSNLYKTGSYVEAQFLIGVEPYIVITNSSTKAYFVAMASTEAEALTTYNGEAVVEKHNLKDIWSGDNSGNRQSNIWTAWYGAENPIPTTATTVTFDESFKDIAWPSGAYMFQGLTNLQYLKGVDNFNTSEIISMRYMFDGCTALINADNDFDSFTGEKVQDMEAMFRNCNKLTSVDFSNMGGTPKLTNWLNYMFQNCYALTSVDLSGMTTGKVVQMKGVFQCTEPKMVQDLLNKDMHTWADNAAGGSHLITANLSSWTFDNCTSMQDMFYGCWRMEDVDFSSAAAAPKLTSLLQLFYKCVNLKSVDLDNFETTSNLTNVARMFCQCESITDIKISKLNTEGVTGGDDLSIMTDGMAEMFSNCRSLTNIDFLQHISTKNCHKFSRMFRSCMSLLEADLHKFETGNVTCLNAMFESCHSLTKVSMLQCDLSKVTTTQYMFNDCPALEVVDFSGVRRMPNLKNPNMMFAGCQSLKTIYCRDFDTDWTTGSISEGKANGASADYDGTTCNQGGACQDVGSVFGKGWYDYGADGGSGGIWYGSTAPSSLVGTPTPRGMIAKEEGETTAAYEARLDAMNYDNVAWEKAKAGDYDDIFELNSTTYKSYLGLKSANLGGYLTAAQMEVQISYDRGNPLTDTVNMYYAGPEGYGLQIVRVMFDNQDITTMTDADGKLYYEVFVERGGNIVKRDVYGNWAATTATPADTINADCDQIIVTVATAETGVAREQKFYIRPIDLDSDDAIELGHAVDGQVYTGEQIRPEVGGEIHYTFTRKNGEEVDYTLTTAEEGTAEAATADIVYSYGENIEDEGTITLTGNATTLCSDGLNFSGGNFYGTKTIIFPIIKVELTNDEVTYTGKEIRNTTLGVKVNGSTNPGNMSLTVNGVSSTVNINYEYNNNICVSYDEDGNVIAGGEVLISFSSSEKSLNFTVVKNFTIKPAPLTITPLAAEVKYGMNVLDYSELEFECTGFVNGETVDGTDGCGNPVFTTLPTATTEYSVTEGVPSTYKAVGTKHNITFEGGVAPNYDITYATEQVLEVVKRKLYVRADNQEVYFGDVAPTYTYVYDGFAEGEDESVLTGILSVTCDYAPLASEVEFVITVDASGLSAENYIIIPVNAKLTVNPVELSSIKNLEYTETEFDNSIKRPTFDLYRYTDNTQTSEVLLASGISTSETNNYYYVVYENYYYVGTATIKVNGDGVHYAGSLEATFNITGDCTLALEKITIDDPVYTGQEIKLGVDKISAAWLKVVKKYYLYNNDNVQLTVTSPISEVDGVSVPLGKELTYVDLSGYTDENLEYNESDYVNAGSKSLSFNEDVPGFDVEVAYKNYVRAHKNRGNSEGDPYGYNDNPSVNYFGECDKIYYEYSGNTGSGVFSNVMRWRRNNNYKETIFSAGGTELQTVYLHGCGFNYNILPKDIDTTNVEGAGAVSIRMPYESTPYTGEEIKPSVIVTYNGVDLVENTDYTLEYTNNISVGTATVTIKGIRETTPDVGNFKGTVTKTFEITKAPLTIRAVVSKEEITYGDACPTLSYEIDADQLLGDDKAHYADPELYGMTESEVLASIFSTIPSPAVTTTYKVSDPLRRSVGTYPVTVGAFVSDNYEISIENTEFNVVKKELTVRANHDDLRVTFGQTEYPNGSGVLIKQGYYGVSVTGFVFDETLDDLTCRGGMYVSTNYRPYPETNYQEAGDICTAYIDNVTGGTCPNNEDVNYKLVYYNNQDEVTTGQLAYITVSEGTLTVTPTADYNYLAYGGGLDDINASWTCTDEFGNTFGADDFDIEPVVIGTNYGTAYHKLVGETFMRYLSAGKKTNYKTYNFQTGVNIKQDFDIVCRDLTPLDPKTSDTDARLQVVGLNADNSVEVAYKNGVEITKSDVLSNFSVQLKNGMNNDEWENLVEGTDFTLELLGEGIGYKGDWKVAGRHHIKITALDATKYCGSFNLDVSIKGTLKVTMSSDSVIYGSGVVCTPSITVTSDDVELTEGVEYKVVYKNETTNETLSAPTKPGLYTVSVVGLDDYAVYEVEYTNDVTQYSLVMPCVIVYNSSQNADFVLTTDAYSGKGLTYKGYTIDGVYGIQGLVLADDPTKTVGTFNSDTYKSDSNNNGYWKASVNIKTVTIDESFEKVRPTTMEQWFGGGSDGANVKQLTALNNTNYLHTELVTSMHNLFNGCSSLTGVDVSTWNTSSVTDMYFLFNHCENLENLDVSTWKTDKVTNMRGLFRYCNSLPTQDLSGWITSNVTNMRAMFSRTSKMTYIDVSTFDVGKVTTIDYMFDNNTTLERIYCADRNTDWSTIGSRNGTFDTCSDKLVGVASDGETQVVWTNSTTSGAYAKAADLGGLFTPTCLMYDVADVVYTGSKAQPTVSNVSYANHENLEEYSGGSDTHLKYVVSVTDPAIDVTDDAEIVVSRADFPDKSTTKNFKILPKSIAEGDDENDTPPLIANSIADKEYTGAAIVLTEAELASLLTYNAMNLVVGTDFEVTSYSNNTDVSTDDAKASVTLTGKGNYKGTRTIEFNITKGCLKTLYDNGDVTIDAIDKQTFTRSAIEPSVVIKRDGTALASTNYALSYANNICVGNATVTITGAGNYADTEACALETAFTIEQAPLSLTANNVSVVYGHNFSEAVTQGYTPDGFISPDDAATLIDGVTYTSDYTTTTNAGEYAGYNKIDVVTPKDNSDCTQSLSNYEVTKVDGKLTVEKANITTEDAAGQITIPAIEDQTYTGSAIEPAITVTYGRNNVALVAGTDYEVSYTNNTNVGTATITITTLTSSTNWYSGNTITRTFNIVKAELTAEVSPTSFVYNVDVQKPTITVRFGETALDPSAATYSLTWSNSNSTNVGSYTVTVMAGSNFSKVNGNDGSQTFTYNITKADQTAPEVVAVAETVCDKNDGKITGVTSAMEYSTDNTTFTAASGDITSLADGTYYVRYAADDNHNASPSTTVTVAAGGKLTVTFETNGGSEVAAKEVCYGNTITEPTTTKDCYTFGGWYRENTLTNAYNFEDGVIDNITLYAKWNVDTYTITWKNDDGTTLETDATAECGSTPSYDGATPTKAATAQYTYTFDKWSPDVVAVSANATYTATYSSTVNKYTVSAISNGNGTATGGGEYDYGTETTLTAAANDCYSFKNWTTDEAGTTEYSKSASLPLTVTSDLTLYANFVVNTYDLKLTAGANGKITNNNAVEDITAGSTKTYSYDCGTTVSIIATPNAGYVFSKWSDNSTEATRTVEVSTAATLSAIFEANSYTVTLNNQDATLAGSLSIEATYAAALPDITTPEKTGYTFGGYYSQTDGGGTQYYNASGEGVRNWDIADNTTLYAKWTVNKYTITYMVDGSQYGATDEYDYNATVTMRDEPTKTGYTFSGWDKTIATMPAENQVVSGTFSINQYTLTFDTDGGSTIEAITADYGTAITAPANPTKTGYTFVNWSPSIPATMPATNTTVTAQWSINQYTITFNTDGGSAIDAITQDYGTDVTAPANPTKTGYTFSSWDKTIPGTMPAENITITAQWTINSYTITFDSDGGSEVAPITQNYGTAITAPANPTKTGYTFNGWNKTIPATMPAEDMTIKAKWGINSYTLTLNRNNNTYGEVTGAGTYDYNTVVNIVATPNYGYKFSKWIDADENTFSTNAETSVTLTENTTLTAVFEPVTFLITAESDLNGTATGTDNYTYKTNATITATPNYGYNFANWTNSSDEVVSSSATYTFEVTKAETFTAHYTAKQYTVTANATEGGSATGTGTYDYNTTATLEATPSAGYSFVNWTNEDDEVVGTEATLNYTVTRDITITANFSINSYHITLTSNGNGTVSGDGTFVYNTSHTISAEPSSCYKFSHWSESADGSDEYSTTASFDVTVTSDITLYANFEILSYTLNLAAGANGTVTNTTASETIAAGENKAYTYDCGTVVSITATPNTGYLFDSWTDGSTNATRDVTISEAITLRASFTPITFYVAYNANSGIGTMATQTFTYDVPQKLTKNTITKEGYAFKGWDTDEAGTMVVYTDEKQVSNLTTTNGTTITLYAVWEAVDYTVTVYNGSADNTTANIGDVVTLTPNDKTGYTFSAWTTTPDLTITNNQFTMPAANVTATAAYTANTYSIDFDKNGADGAEVMTSLTATYDTPIALTANAYTNTGYTYTGWNTEADGTGTAFTNGQTVSNLATSGHFTLYAQWVANNYTIVYDKNATDATGSTISTSATYDVDVEIAANGYTREGYDFTGWNTQAGGTGVAYTEGQTVKNLTATDGGTYTLYAQWSVNSYTATWMRNDGTTDQFTTTNFSYGASITAPTSTPSREGYTFLGWSTQATATAADSDLGTMSVSGVTYYAVWQINQYELTWYLDATDATYGTVDYTSGTTTFNAPITAPDAERTGYTLSGWSETQSGSVVAVETTMPAKDIDYHAIWSVNMHTITWNANSPVGIVANLSGDYTSGSTAYGTTITKPNATCVGYELKGWAESADGATVTPVTKMPDADVTYYAIWEAATGTQYIVNHYLQNLADDDYTLEDTDILYGTTNGTTNAVANSYTGFTAGIVTQSVIAGDGSTSIDIYYSRNSYTLAWEFSEGTTEQIAGADYTAAGSKRYGSDVSAPALTRIGFDTYSWSPTVASTMPANDVTYTAQWVANKFTITYDGKGGVGSMNNQTFNYGEAQKLTANAFIKDGYTFKGWDIQTDATTIVYTDEQKVSDLTTTNGATIKLYAVWEAIDYTVIVVEGVANKSTANIGDVVTLTPDDKTGYTFTGWTIVDGNGNSVAQTSNTFVMPAANVTATANYEAKQHQITVIDGTADTYTAIYEQTITLAANDKSGYNFTGWTVVDANGNAITVSGSQFTMPDADVTATAEFVMIDYTITVQSGTASQPTANYGNTVTIVADAPDAGKEFSSWTIEVGEGASVTNATNATTTLTVGMGNVVVKANYTWTEYTITVNNGTPSQTTAHMGEQVTITAADANIGKEFSKWTLDSGDGASILTDINSETVVTIGSSDVVVTATYADVEYAINVVGGSANYATATYETTVQLTADTKTGYTFSSWSTDPAVSVSFLNTFVMPASDIDVTANFTPNSYTIEYVNNGGVGTAIDQDAVYDEDVVILSNTKFTKAGYEFLGWNTEADGLGTNYYPGSTQRNLATEGIVTLYAQWTIAGYIITFDNNGGKGSMATQQINYDVSDYLSKCTFTKTGYKFTGWNIEADGTGKSYTDQEYVSNITAGEAITLYAQWEKIEYYVVFNANADDAEGTMNKQTFTFDDAAALTINAYSRKGYVFTGWNRNAEGTSVGYADGEEVENLSQADGDEVILYAQWTKNNYTITFNANNGTGTMDKQQMTYDVEATLTPNAYTRDGYNFINWATSADGSGSTYEDKQTVKNLVGENNGNINLYAQWKANTYTIEFQANHANVEGTMSNQTFTFDIAQSLTANGYTVEGYTFQGWATSIDGAAVYTDGQSISNLTTTNGATIKLYAVWSTNSYYVAFDGNGSTSGAMSNQSFTFDDTRALKKNTYTMLGYNFTGWNTERDGSGTSYIDEQLVNNLTTVANSTITLYAQWTEGTYTITTDAFTVSSHNVATMGTVVSLTPLEKTGYEWVDWTSSPVVTFNDDNTFVMPASDITITTRYAVITYDITYNLAGGTNSDENPDAYSILSDEIVFANPTRNGYNFVGWFDNTNNQITSIPAGSIGDVTITAKWKADIDIECINKFDFITTNVPTSFITCENEDSITVTNTTAKSAYTNCDGKTLTGAEIMKYVEYSWKVNGELIQSGNSPSFRLPDGVSNTGYIDLDVSLLDDTLSYQIPYEIRHRFICIMWNDVISVINNGEASGGDTFIDNRYEWYHNGSLLEGETGPYYCQWGGLTGNYYLVAYTADGTKYTSCYKYCDQIEATSLIAYPNPSAGLVNLKGGTWQVGDAITVVNSSGQTVINQPTKTLVHDKIDLSGLPQGTYVIKIGNDVVSVIKR